MFKDINILTKPWLFVVCPKLVSFGSPDGNERFNALQQKNG
jgi:hypothetical protein